MVYYRYNGEIKLYRAGGDLASSSTGKNLSTWRHVKIVANGSNIKVYVDGNLEINHNDGTYTNGYFGFNAFGVSARYDSLVVKNDRMVYYVRGANGEVLAEYDGGGNLLAEYVYANGQRIAKLNPGGNIDFYLNDHLGSARAMVGSGWSANYYPFGELASQTGSDEDTRYDFTGHERDRGTALIYAGARFYDPELGRWVSVDPIAEIHPGWTPYNYVLNNPLSFIDPNGLKEYADSLKGKIELGEGDWFTSDRIGNTLQWRKANKHNLGRAGGYLEYETMEQREGFYRWLANDLESFGFQTKWVAAASWVNQIILGSKTWNIFSVILSPKRPVLTADAISALDEINAAILAHVWTRLSDLYHGDILVRRQAEIWDKSTVDFEQVQNPALQVIYSTMPGHVKEDLQRGLTISGMAGSLTGDLFRFGPAFNGSVMSAQDRAAYGMAMIDVLKTNPKLYQQVLAGR